MTFRMCPGWFTQRTSFLQTRNTSYLFYYQLAREPILKMNPYLLTIKPIFDTPE
jgi:hypothetical protein